MSEKVSVSLVIGIVSGILTAATIQVLLLFFKNVIVIWYRRLIHKGIDISGEWKTDYVYGTGTRETNVLNITQTVDKIDALLIITQLKSDQESPTVKNYNLKGEIRERFLTLSGANANPKALGVVSLLLQVTGAGDEMAGFDSFYNVTTNKIESYVSLWKRSESVKNGKQENNKQENTKVDSSQPPKYVQPKAEQPKTEELPPE